jgi:hypothetical protein
MFPCPPLPFSYLSTAVCAPLLSSCCHILHYRLPITLATQHSLSCYVTTRRFLRFITEPDALAMIFNDWTVLQVQFTYYSRILFLQAVAMSVLQIQCHYVHDNK